MACNSLLTTSLLQVVNRLDASCRVIQQMSRCNKSVKLTSYPDISLGYIYIILVTNANKIALQGWQ